MKETSGTASVENCRGGKPGEATCLFAAPGQAKTFWGSTWTEILLEWRTRGTVSGKIWGPDTGDRAAGVCGPQLVSQEKWRPWAGLTLGIRTLIQVATIQGDGKKKRWHRPLERYCEGSDERGCFLHLQPWNRGWERSLRESDVGWGCVLIYIRIGAAVTEPEDHEKAWEMTQNLLLKLR